MPDPGRPLKLDQAAASADPALPGFLARSPGAPVYHGFPIIPESMTDGWYYGAITDSLGDGNDAGDGYVVAPDGRRAGLVWEVGTGAVQQILPPDEDRWGVYQVWFPHPIQTTNDLVGNFRHVLPTLQAIYSELYPPESRR